MNKGLFTVEDMQHCNIWVTENHWCRNETCLIIHGADLSTYDINEGLYGELSNGYLSFLGAGIGWLPKTVVVNPEKEITKTQWIELGYEDYMLDFID